VRAAQQQRHLAGRAWASLPRLACGEVVVDTRVCLALVHEVFSKSPQPVCRGPEILKKRQVPRRWRPHHGVIEGAQRSRSTRQPRLATEGLISLTDSPRRRRQPSSPLTALRRIAKDCSMGDGGFLPVWRYSPMISSRCPPADRDHRSIAVMPSCIGSHAPTCAE